MNDRDLSRLCGEPSKAQLAILRKHDMQFDFVRHAVREPDSEIRHQMAKPKDRGLTTDKRMIAKRASARMPHATSDLRYDRDLRERHALLSITRRHKCQNSDTCRCGKLAAKPVHGLGMKHFMRDIVRQGQKRYHPSVRKLHVGRENAAILLRSVMRDCPESLHNIAPLMRNFVRVVKRG